MKGQPLSSDHPPTLGQLTLPELSLLHPADCESPVSSQLRSSSGVMLTYSARTSGSRSVGGRGEEGGRSQVEMSVPHEVAVKAVKTRAHR